MPKVDGIGEIDENEIGENEIGAEDEEDEEKERSPVTSSESSVPASSIYAKNTTNDEETNKGSCRPPDEQTVSGCHGNDPSRIHDDEHTGGGGDATAAGRQASTDVASLHVTTGKTMRNDDRIL